MKMRQSHTRRVLSNQFRHAIRAGAAGERPTRLVVEKLEDRRVLAASIMPDSSLLDMPGDVAQNDVFVSDQAAGAADVGPARSAPTPIASVGADASHWSQLEQAGVTRTAVPGELVIGIEAGQSFLDLIEHSRESNLQAPVIMGPLITDTILSLDQTQLDVVHLRFSGSDQLDEIISFATEIPGVNWAQPNYQYTGDIMDFIPNDPLFAQQYHHNLMGNPQAWDITLGDSSVVVAVTDDGVQVDHPDLAANMWTNDLEANGLFGIDDDNNGFVDDIFGYDFVADKGDPSPIASSNDHGTHVAGIIAGVTNNDNQIAGTAGGASIMALRIAGNDGGFTSTIMANTFAYAIDNGARIANTSYNINRFVGDSTFTAGLQYFYDGGGLHFNSAGNANELNPARQAFEQTLLVASTDATDTKSSFTNYGTGIDIAAPGSSILSTVTNSGTGTKSGTSMAAPNAAGAAALIWSANPGYSRDQVAAQLLGTADNIDTQNPAFVGLLGSGRVNTFSALTDTLAAPQLKRQTGLPADGSQMRQSEPLSDFTLQFDQVMDPAAVNDAASYELRYAGANGVFDDADDVLYPVTPTSTYLIGSNSTSYTFGAGPFEIGSYRFSLIADQLVNPFGTQLDADGDGTGGDDFSTLFEIVMNPLEQVGAPGTLLYGTSISAQIAAAAEIDSYTFDLNADQLLSVAIAPSVETLQPSVEVIGPTGAVLATGTAASAGLAASVNGLPLAADGTYTLRVTGASDSVGPYEVALSLNATLETESVDGASNDTFATAQSLEPSFMPLSATADRGAVIGSDSNVGPSQTQVDVFAPRVLNYSLTDLPIPTGDGFVQVTAFADLDLTTEFLSLDIENMPSQDIFVDDGAQSQVVVTSIPLTLDQINAIIADGQADFTLTPSPLVAELDEGSWATVQLQYPVADDFYSFSLAGGQSASIVVTGDGNPDVQLFDSNETLLAIGRSSDAIDQVINNFTATVAEDYVIKIAGEGAYSVTVTRGADFDTETNNTFETAQDPDAALGFIEATAFATTNVKTDFPGIDSLDSFCGCEPPDTHAAVGLEHVVEVVNTSIAMFDKSGNVLSAPQPFTTFFDSSIIAGESFTFDPVVAYMEDVDRWAVAVLSGATAGAAETDLLVAVSDSSDPTGNWTEQHRVDFSGISPGLFADYPKIGWNADALVVTLNMFAGSSFQDVNLVTIDKASVMDNDRGTFTSYLSERTAENFTMAAATMHDSDPGAPLWFVGQTAFSGTRNNVRLTRMDNPLSDSPQFSTFLVPVSTYVGGNLPNAPQPGGSRQANDSRMMNAEMRDNRLVASHTVNVGGEPKATWYEFDLSNPNNPQFTQQATVDPGAGIATYFPSVAINQAGDIGLTYMQSSLVEFTSMYVAGQAAGGLPGTMSPPQLVKAGNQTFPGSRSGDYSGITVDPVTDTFWAANEVSLSGAPDPRWSTHIAEFSVMPILDTDYYSFSANSGDTFVIETDLPIGGPLAPHNGLDPTITLYAPDGSEVAADNDSLDGINATLTHTATQTGSYRVSVSAQTLERGEYFVDIQGATGPNPAPQVASLDPFDGQGLIAFPTTVRVDFSEAILLPSVAANDMTIGGLPATAVTIIDGDTMEFAVDPAANVGDGSYTIHIAAGSLTDLQGQTIAADFNSEFILDTTGPRILSTSWNGQPFPANAILLDGPLTIEAIFNESLFTIRSARTGLKAPGVGDVVLTNTTTGSSVNPDTVSFDPITLNFTAGFNRVEPGLYSVTFVSGDGAFEDALGNDLDGEPIGPANDSTPSGDGSKGGDFTLNFEVDFVTADANEFGGLVPAGSLISSSLGNITRLHDATDSDGFTFYANAGETISSIAGALDATARATIELVGLSSPVTSSPGGEAVMPPIVIPADGIYELRLAADKTTGGYVQLYRNATVERLVGDSSATNQLDISDSFSAVGPGRYAVLARSVLGTGDNADEFLVDLTGKTGVPHDIILTGLTANYSTELLEVIAPDGTVLATGSVDPLSSGSAVTNFDQGILGFTAPSDGVYTIRLTADTTAGQYSIVVTEGHAFEVENNNNPTPSLRSLDGLGFGIGFVSPGIDTFGEFLDPAAFLQAVPSNLAFETFDSTLTPPGQVGVCGFTINATSNDQCYTPGSILPGIEVTAPGSALNELVVLGSGFPIVGNPTPVVGASAFINNTQIAFDPPVFAVGLELWINQTDFVGYTVFDPTGVIIGASTLLVADSRPNFFGFTSEEPIGSVLFSSTRGELVDNVAFGGSFIDNDLWTATYTAGQYVQLSATALLDDPMHSPANGLDPEIRVIHPDGSTIVAQDSDSLDGKNAVVSFFAPVDGVYTIEVEGQDSQGEYLLGAPEDTQPPVVVDVVASSSQWNAAFIDIVDGGGAGAGNGLGLSMPGTAQTRNLPWADGIDRLYVTFSEDVSATWVAANVSLIGTNSGNIPISLLEYGVAGENVATIGIASGITNDRLVLSITEGVTDSAKNRLDGEWTTDSSLVSGDGSQGGQFNFFFDVLVGDVNNSDAVNVTGDVLAVFAQNGMLPSTLAEAYFDVTHDGAVNVTGDVLTVFGANGSILPGLPPTPPGSLRSGGGASGGNSGGLSPEGEGSGSFAERADALFASLGDDELTIDL